MGGGRPGGGGVGQDARVEEPYSESWPEEGASAPSALPYPVAQPRLGPSGGAPAAELPHNNAERALSFQAAFCALLRRKVAQSRSFLPEKHLDTRSYLLISGALRNRRKMIICCSL